MKFNEILSIATAISEFAAKPTAAAATSWTVTKSVSNEHSTSAKYTEYANTFRHR